MIFASHCCGSGPSKTCIDATEVVAKLENSLRIPRNEGLGLKA